MSYRFPNSIVFHKYLTQLEDNLYRISNRIKKIQDPVFLKDQSQNVFYDSRLRITNEDRATTNDPKAVSVYIESDHHLNLSTIPRETSNIIKKNLTKQIKLYSEDNQQINFTIYHK